jgi:hypothetical protein
LYADGLKLLDRNKDDWENGIKIVTAISKDNVYYGLEKCAKVCLKHGRVQSRRYVGSTFEKNIEGLDPRKHIHI